MLPVAVGAVGRGDCGAGVLPCNLPHAGLQICPFDLTQTSAAAELGPPLEWGTAYLFNGTTAADVACAVGCLGGQHS
jgi:hypothetical protein